MLASAQRQLPKGVCAALAGDWAADLTDMAVLPFELWVVGF